MGVEKASFGYSRVIPLVTEVADCQVDRGKLGGKCGSVNSENLTQQFFMGRWRVLGTPES